MRKNVPHNVAGATKRCFLQRVVRFQRQKDKSERESRKLISTVVIHFVRLFALYVSPVIGVVVTTLVHNCCRLFTLADKDRGCP